MSLILWNFTSLQYQRLGLRLLLCEWIILPVSVSWKRELPALLGMVSSQLMECLKHASIYRIFRFYLILLFFGSFYLFCSLSRIWVCDITLVLELLCTHIFKNNSFYSHFYSDHFNKTQSFLQLCGDWDFFLPRW